MSQSPADGPDRTPPWDAFCGGGAPADYIEVMMVAEFGRLRAQQLEASKARGDRVRSRDAECPAEELGFEMTASAYSAGLLLDMAANIVGRLPSALAAMAAGTIDRGRARVISNATLRLPGDLAAEADKILAGAAPGMRLADLAGKAARLEARLDPDGVQRRKDEARHDRRVELRRLRPPPTGPAETAPTASRSSPIS